MKINMNIKRIIATVLSLAIVVGGLSTADYILKYRSNHGVKQCIALYKQPKNSIDVAFMGSSHIHYGVNTAKLWEDYGIAAFDYSTAEQPLWVTYYCMQELYKTQNPNIIVLDCFVPAATDDNYKFRYTHFADTLNGFKFSLTKLKLMYVAFDNLAANWNKFFPVFFGYHDRYDKLTDFDYEALEIDYHNYKGFVPYFNDSPGPVPEVNMDVIEPPTEKSQEYLQKIFDLTKEHGTKLYLTVVPYRVNSEMVMDVVQSEDTKYNWINQYVLQKNEEGYDNVFFDYTMTHLDQIGLDWEGGTDIYDESHLNMRGSYKFAHYIARQLRDIYGEDMTPDHRGDERYASWDAHVEMIKEIAAENGVEW